MKSERKLVVVGGSPALRVELGRALGTAVQLRLVDGTGKPSTSRAQADVAWADTVVLLCGSQLTHKLGNTYSAAARRVGKPLARVPRRGVQAVIDGCLGKVAGETVAAAGQGVEHE